MTGEYSPDFECGKVLYCLKISRLNYVVKETPYSAYITIRKKFIKESLNVENSVNAIKPDEKEVVLKNLKDLNKDLQTRLAQAKVEFEQMEIAKDKMIADISKQSDEIDRFLRNERTLNQEIFSITKERDNLNSVLQKVSKKKISITKDLEENNMMLENVIESSNIKINSLEERVKEYEDNIRVPETTPCKKCDFDSKKENNLQEQTSNQLMDADESEPSTSKCGQCDYESDSESEMKMHMHSKHALLCEECSFNSDNTNEMKNHMKKMHSTKCKFCNETFVGERKLKKHLCRLYIINPSFEDYYMKNWFVRDDCIRIFSDSQKVDIGMIHSEKCIESSHCSYLPHQLITKTNRFVDDNFYAHMPASKYLLDGSVNWNILKH